MNKHAKKMIANITAANDKGVTCRAVAHYAAEFTALDKLEAAGEIFFLQGSGPMYGYVVVGHPLTRDAAFQAKVISALSDAERVKHRAEREIISFEKLLGRNV